MVGAFSMVSFINRSVQHASILFDPQVLKRNPSGGSPLVLNAGGVFHFKNRIRLIFITRPATNRTMYKPDVTGCDASSLPSQTTS